MKVSYMFGRATLALGDLESTLTASPAYHSYAIISREHIYLVRDLSLHAIGALLVPGKLWPQSIE